MTRDSLHIGRLTAATIATIVTCQLTASVQVHAHLPGVDVHERAWCDGNHGPGDHGESHDPQACEACGRRGSPEPHAATRADEVLAFERLGRRLDAAAPPTLIARWLDGRAPARAPPSAS